MATIPLSLYLWRRIHQVGIRSVMGVPGDFNLNWLDAIDDVPGLNWVGNANELNAAYAADGYARATRRPGCLVTTQGVGELSAINGVAGAASENVPMIHVVGQTQRAAQDGHVMIHHCIGSKPDHQIYSKLSAPLRCASALLWDAEKAPAEIDRVIRECFIQRLPVYIFFPIDMTLEQVPAALLDREIDLSLPVDTANEAAAVEAIKEALCAAKQPAVFVDYLVHPFGELETRQLAEHLRLPTYTSQMAKGVIDEQSDYYLGIYNGAITEAGSERIKESDLILCLGWFDSDCNSSFFTRGLPASARIDVLSDHVIVCGKTFTGVHMAPLLGALARALDPMVLQRTALTKVPRAGVPPGEPDAALTHDYLWPAFSHALLPGDIVLTDTGTASYGMPDADFPRGTTFIAQYYYMSIGFATPASLGCDLALAEMHADSKQSTATSTDSHNDHSRRRRTVCVTGDGSLQLTLQEIGTMVARRARVVIVILNNAGYTIERAIHGAGQAYNDISPYQHRHLLALFGAAEPDRQYRACRTRAEFEAAMAEPAVREPRRVEVVELFVGARDIPWRLAQALCMRPGMGVYLARGGFSGLKGSEEQSKTEASTTNGHAATAPMQ